MNHPMKTAAVTGAAWMLQMRFEEVISRATEDFRDFLRIPA